MNNATQSSPVGYVLYAFPQLSETFIEGERAELERSGLPVRVYSIFPPPADLAGTTTAPAGSVKYKPGRVKVALHLGFWALRRPGVTASNLRRAIRARSQTMANGVFWSGWLASQFRKDGVGNVHAHFGYEPACAGLPAARLAGLPFSFTIHARDIYVRNRGLDTRIDDADRVVTVCDYNVDQILERFPAIPRDRFDIVYCGVDPSTFACAAPPPRTDEVRLLSVGRLVEKKGFNDLIRAVAELRRGGAPVVCDIVGGGELFEELVALAKELDVADAVRLTGALSPVEVAERLAACDVFVLACRIDTEGDRDSMPVVLKEAMATCRPVVATSTVGIPELVDDEVGVLVDANDPVDLARGIKALVDAGPERRAELGRAGRKRVEDRFNLKTETATLRRIFTELRA